MKHKHVSKNMLFLMIGLSIFILATNVAFAAENDTTTDGTGTVDLKPIGAGLAVALAGIGSALGMGRAGSAAIGAITEKPEVFGKAFLFIVLIEAVAIYGLLVAILMVL